MSGFAQAIPPNSKPICLLRAACGGLQGKTEVLVQEASNTVSYVLDENLIDFGSALEARDYDRYDTAQCVMLGL